MLGYTNNEPKESVSCSVSLQGVMSMLQLSFNAVVFQVHGQALSQRVESCILLSSFQFFTGLLKNILFLRNKLASIYAQVSLCIKFATVTRYWKIETVSFECITLCQPVVIIFWSYQVVVSLKNNSTKVSHQNGSRWTAKVNPDWCNAVIVF